MWSQGKGRGLLRPFWSFESVLMGVFIVTVTGWRVPGLGLLFGISLGEQRETMAERGQSEQGSQWRADLKAKLRRWCLEM